ncbi:MAG TPA: HlyD family efflux transporter periplasmic adaptor subunit [bacterium]|nr:HlyD family efflux transporter periplasmic adaptor subunit [bacterium]
MKNLRTIRGPRSAVLILLACFLVGAGCGKTKKWGNGGANSGGFRPVEVTRDDLQITVLATGNVQPKNQLDIKPPISGRIEKILIQEGQYVKKGQVLVELSSTERATLLDAARAQGPDALKKWEDLYQSTPLLSPLSGQIVNLPTVPGQVVSTADTIMVMSDHLIVNTQVDETDLAQIRLGQDAVITLDAYPGQSIPAKVRRIAYQSVLSNNVTTYPVEVWPDKVPPFMRSGMTANVVFKVSEKDDVLVIPSEAIQQGPDGSSYVLEGPAKKGDKPQTVAVQTGMTDGKQTEIVSGLAEGDKVLIKSFSAGQLSAPSTGTNPFMPNMRGGKSSGGGNRGGGH